jgi:hypothetical protein
MLLIIFILIAAGCAVAVFRWRWGVFAVILVGLLQDPLRKMVPGIPGYLAMASLPVWIATLGSALFSGEVTARSFLSDFPRLSRWTSVFGCYLFIPAALSASYGRNSWMITLLGAVIYSCAFFVLACGWRFPRAPTSVVRILGFYCLAASVLLIGGPIDYFGLAKGVAAVGTEAMDVVWMTARTGEILYMYAGFFRSPDVMGWHAALVTMIASILAIRSRGWMRWLWIGLAVWGVLNMWICGRRKMISMLPVYWGCLLVLTFRLRGMKKTVLLAGVLSILVGFAWYGVTRTYQETAINTFYGSTIDDLGDRVFGTGVGAVRETVRQAGFWGYGLGMGQQGIHHINADKPRLWQEDGSGKIVAELGVPGAIILLLVAAVVLLTAYQVVKLNSSSAAFIVYAGAFSILIANLASAVVSAQIFGDPFVMLFLSFILGLILSGARNTNALTAVGRGRCEAAAMNDVNGKNRNTENLKADL